MKHLLLLASLVSSVLLLSACPDSKLPTPGPKAPEPKATAAQLFSPPCQLDLTCAIPALLTTTNT